MRNKLLIILFVFSCNGMFAQEYDDGPVDRSYRLAIGPKVGVGAAFGSRSNQQNLDFSSGLCYQVGIGFDAHFGRRYDLSDGGTGLFGLRLEALYAQRNLRLGSSLLGQRCIEMPVLVQFYFTSSMALEVGTTFVHVLKCTPSQLEYQGSHYNTGAITGNDVMLTLGACYSVSPSIALDARFNMGLSDIAGNFDTKVSTLVLSAIYKFVIVK